MSHKVIVKLKIMMENAERFIETIIKSRILRAVITYSSNNIDTLPQAE